MIWMWVAERNEREGILAQHADARAALAGAELIEPTRRRRHVLVDWRPDDEGFWAATGRRIANRNLWLSMPALLLAFAVWVVWSVIVVELPHIGFKFTHQPAVLAGGAAGALGRGLPRAVLVRRADLRRAQLHGVEHDDAAAAHAVDRLRGAGPDHQLRGVRGDRAAVRPGRGQLLVQRWRNISFFYPKRLQGTALGAQRRRGQPGRRAGAAHRADRDVRRRAADPGRQRADPRGSGRDDADLGAERRLHLGAADRRLP